MENLLPQGLKNLNPSSRYARFIFTGLGILVFILYFLFFKPPDLDNKNIYKVVSENIETIEAALRKKNQRYQNRAKILFDKYRLNTLQHSHLNSNEALIIEDNGIIKYYFGEIYYFKFRPMKIGDWALIKKSDNIYFTRRMADHVFYVRHFCNLENNLVVKGMKYTFPVYELKYSKISLPNRENNRYYDENKGMFFYDYLLKPSNGQLILNLKFSREDIEIYYRKREKLFLCISIFLILFAALFFLLLKKRAVISQLLWLALLADLFVFISFVIPGERNLYLHVKFLGLTFGFDSIYQILIILMAVLSILYFLRKRLRIRILSFILFNTFLVLVFKISTAVFKGVNFNYQDFSLNYLSLLVVIFLLHLLPLLFIKEMAYHFNTGLNTKKTGFRIRAEITFFLMQTSIALFISLVFKINIVNILVVSVIAFMLLFFKRNFFTRAAIIFLLAVSIYHLTSGHSLREKQEFIARNLKKIFLNQNNYAKFIAREIIYEINLSEDFSKFFQEKSASKLESIWRKTLASRENIASGIFIESKDKEISYQFANQIPFLKVKTRRAFPFWALDDSTAEVHGKEIPMAVAATAVHKDSQYLGRMIVQVMNSPELLLGYQDKINIFTIDNKINGRDLSYIILNKENQILENPSNINLENITGILENNDRWITFKYMDLAFKGYIFRHLNNSIIIFFPVNTLFKELSEMIKIFLFFSLFFLLFYAKDLNKIDWKSVYYSYSIRVFSFLILISLLTAVIFSIFFFNFSYRSSEQKIMRMVYENGRTAQNIGYNLIKSSGEFSRSHLFAIAQILNADVSVYDRFGGGLVETSNYRKFINSSIPVNLHSQILNLLNEKNQKFFLIEDEEGFHLFYKIYDYIFMLAFPNKWEQSLSEDRYYTDFIITLFFILSIIGFSTAFFFRNRILSPIDGLSKGMAEVKKGNLPRLENVPSEIEIKSLYTGFNAMIEGIREQKKSISEISRMKTLIKLGRRVAHEVKNPLTPIKLSAEQILKSLEDKNPRYEEIIKQSVNYIIDETEHLKKVSYGFLDLSRLDEIKPEAFDLVGLIGEELFKVRQVYSYIDFFLDVEGDVEKVIVSLDRIKIKQVFKNLINNSIEAIGEKKGELRLSVEKKGDRVITTVTDNGAGMDETEFTRAFEADYSTKDIGTGLGLFIVKRIVDLHKGNIEIISEKDKGTRVVLDLPERL